MEGMVARPNTVCPPPLYFHQSSRGEEHRKTSQLEFSHRQATLPVQTLYDSRATALHWLALQQPLPASPEPEASQENSDGPDGGDRASTQDRLLILTALAEEILGIGDGINQVAPKTVLVNAACQTAETKTTTSRKKCTKHRSQSNCKNGDPKKKPVKEFVRECCNVTRSTCKHSSRAKNTKSSSAANLTTTTSTPRRSQRSASRDPPTPRCRPSKIQPQGRELH